MYINYFSYFCSENQLNTNKRYMHNFCAKYGKNRDIYKQMAKVFWASLSLRRLVLRYRFADYVSTRLQDYEWLPPWTSLALRRRSSFEPASQTTSLQDNKPATAPLVVSLTRCLVVWRSNAKLNFRNSIFPATALLVVSLTRCLVVWRSQGLVVLATP